MAGWLGTLTALPMSWHSDAKTTSSLGAGALGPGGRLQRVGQLVGGEAVGDVGERLEHREDAVGHPALVGRGLGADDHPLLERWTRPCG